MNSNPFYRVAVGMGAMQAAISAMLHTDADARVTDAIAALKELADGWDQARGIEQEDEDNVQDEGASVATTDNGGAVSSTFGGVSGPDQALASLEISPAILSAGQVGQPYSAAFASTSPHPTTFAVVGAPLPEGLALSPEGVLAGTPVAGSEGTHIITVHAVDQLGATGEATYTFTVQAAVAPAATDANEGGSADAADGDVTSSEEQQAEAPAETQEGSDTPADNTADAGA